MRWPVDADVLETLEADVDRASGLVERDMQIDAQAGHRRSLYGRRAMRGQRGETRFGRHELAGHVLAFRPMQFQGKGEAVPALQRSSGNSSAPATR